MGNLRALCAYHHQRKSSGEGARARADGDSRGANATAARHPGRRADMTP
jgi:hypothetical protein